MATWREAALRSLDLGGGKKTSFYALPELERAGLGAISRLPVSLRIMLESLVRNLDGKRVREEDVRHLAGWKPNARREAEVPFVVARVLLQDFTGVPLVVDLAAMRGAVARLGKDPQVVEPLVPVDLVVDHSVQVDFFGTSRAYAQNLEAELTRNRARYEFLKWGMQAFDGFNIVPPGIGICHQVNLEYLAKCVLEKDGVAFPDTLVGTDSHTTMVNGLGVVGWGVGGIEAEAGMLGQPVYFLMPDVVGVNVSGALKGGVTATDLVLHVTELLRKVNVVGKLVEFHGEGTAGLAVPERATLANMSPEYGATIGFFPVDEASCHYLEATGRPPELVDLVRRYYQAQGMFGIPRAGAVDYTQVVELDLGAIEPSVSGPKRPQDRIALRDLKARWGELLRGTPPQGYGHAEPKRVPVELGSDGPGPVAGGGRQDGLMEGVRRDTSELTEYEMVNNRPTPDRVPVGPAAGRDREESVGDGDVLIAAITSCTNTSNPSVMLGAGLLAKKAHERGLTVRPTVKTSLAPGSRVVSDYLEKTGLQRYLDALGFQLVGYGCTTCIGNSGPLDPQLEEALAKNEIVGAAVLSGNRNFEARVHQSLRANFLMSPPLVVAFALAGTVDIDLAREPLGHDRSGKPVYLHDLWPSSAELEALLGSASDAEAYRRRYRDVAAQNPAWNEVCAPAGAVYAWEPASTYVREPPYFEGYGERRPPPGDLRGARALAVFGDSVTTDHISPAGAIRATAPAGLYLQAQGVAPADFNSYGARRGNHEVMVRGTFANVRIRNLLVPGTEGGVTVHAPSGERMNIFDAALRYAEEGVPLVILAGEEYGTGSSRDWAAKGTRLLGVRAVIAQSFERIHRSNLVGMGVLPCQLPAGVSARTLGLTGAETFDLAGIESGVRPRAELALVVHRASGASERIPVTLRIDTPIEVEYFRAGGILPYVLGQLLAA